MEFFSSSYKNKAGACICFALFFLFHNPSHAMYQKTELANVPIERLITNLTIQHEANPQDNQILFSLARSYAMAFASGSPTVNVIKDKEKYGPWFGYEGPNVPYVEFFKKDNTIELNSEKKEYLTKAIELHKEALSNDPQNLYIQIGLAWCSEQNGNIDEAIYLYRKIIEASWPKDKKALSPQQGFVSGEVPMYGTPFITEEASQYLSRLLNSDRDREEIDKLAQYQLQLKDAPRMMTPIVISLGDRIDFLDIKDKQKYVFFDLDGSGIPKQWEWVNPAVGFLVFDKNQSGVIDSAIKMFGNVTFWMFWENGYLALKSLDNDGDGKLEGNELEGLAIWRDVNQNGQSERDEVRSLALWGIKMLDCSFSLLEDGTPFNPSGVLFNDGITRPSYDIRLSMKISTSVDD